METSEQMQQLERENVLLKRVYEAAEAVLNAKGDEIFKSLGPLHQAVSEVKREIKTRP